MKENGRKLCRKLCVGAVTTAVSSDGMTCKPVWSYPLPPLHPQVLSPSPFSPHSPIPMIDWMFLVLRLHTRNVSFTPQFWRDITWGRTDTCNILVDRKITQLSSLAVLNSGSLFSSSCGDPVTLNFVIISPLLLVPIGFLLHFLSKRIGEVI